MISALCSSQPRPRSDKSSHDTAVPGCSLILLCRPRLNHLAMDIPPSRTARTNDCGYLLVIESGPSYEADRT